MRKNSLHTNKQIYFLSSRPGFFCFYSDLIKRLQKSNFEVVLISSDIPKLHTLQNEFKCKIFPTKITRRISPIPDAISILKLTRYLKKEKPDIIHAHTPKGGLIGMLSSWLGRVHIRIYTIHGLPMETSSGLMRKVLWLAEWLSCKLATQVLAVSNSLKELIIEERLCPSSKIQVLGDGSACGINLDKFSYTEHNTESKKQTRDKLKIPHEAKVLGFVGRIVPDKGIQCLIDAFETVQKSFDNIYLLLIGPFDNIRETVDNEIKHRIKNNRHIICCGVINDIVPYYSAMDIFVLPTRREGFGLTLVEAGAMGLPVISTKITGCIDAVADNITGLLIERDNNKQLVEAMLKLLEDSELRKNLGHNGRKRAGQLFDSKRLVAEHIALYEKLTVS